jgi:hypothetical protein
MKFATLFSLAVMPLGLLASEIPAPATEVMVFRNNTALIRYQALPKGAAVFTVTGNFSPLEGTLWASSNVKQIRKTLTEISRKEPVPFSDITATYKNQRVTLRLTAGNGKIEKVSGTVLALYPKEQSGNWNRIVTLKCADGRILAIQQSQITGVESAALKVAEKTVKEQKQAWEFTLTAPATGKVIFDCLAKTLGWTPALKMTLLPEKKFVLDTAATVFNNGDDLQNVKCILWAGAPNIENSSAFSPMAIVKHPANAPVPRAYDAAPVMKTYLRMRNIPAAAMAENAEPAAPGLTGNMAPFEIGTLSLKKGEALVRQLGRASGTYESLVRWQIPARQGDNGRQVWKNNGSYTGELWECLRFTNPFKTAVPDGSVEICDGSRVLAQIKGTWVNPGEQATWEVARCRDVKATFAEQEAPSSIPDRGKGIFQRFDHGVLKSTPPPRAGKVKAQPVSVKGGWINNTFYRVTDIKGQIELKNFRKSPVKVVIEMDYFGEFVSASGKPVKTALNHFGSLNPKNKLTWQMTLKPEETRKLDFRYNIIINR